MQQMEAIREREGSASTDNSSNRKAGKDNLKRKQEVTTTMRKNTQKDENHSV